MIAYFIRCLPDGNGRGYGSVDESELDSRVAEDLTALYARITAQQYQEIAGRPDLFGYDKQSGFYRKHAIVLTSSKARFKGDGADSCVISWKVPEPISLRINGQDLLNNPHERGIEIKWDQAQWLRIDVDDTRYSGECEVLAE